MRELWAVRNPSREIPLVAVTLLMSLALILLPTVKENPTLEGTERVRALVLEVDDSQAHRIGFVHVGTQAVRAKILDGRFAGIETWATNHYKGVLEIDKEFRPGDVAFGVVNAAGDRIVHVNLLDHYRLDALATLLALFAASLTLLAGWTGFKALTSFVFIALLIWKGFLPMILMGLNPIPLALLTVAVISASASLSAGGVSRRGLVALGGCVSGMILTCALSILFGKALKIHGAVMPFTETLLHSGFGHLDLTSLFLASTFVACSGAIVDVAIDISASQEEVAKANPSVGRLGLLLSGLSVSKSVISSMSNTLLLAYSGSYMGLLLSLNALGIPAYNILNLRHVAAEILHTLVGSLGMIWVAPLTSLIGSLSFLRK